jgi:hypothetical protein
MFVFSPELGTKTSGSALTNFVCVAVAFSVAFADKGIPVVKMVTHSSRHKNLLNIPFLDFNTTIIFLLLKIDISPYNT